MRTLGSKDIYKRKVRKDKGKRRKKANIIRFKKVRGHKTHLKLWMWREEVMSADGYRNWNRKIRPFVRRVVYKFDVRIDAPTSEICTKEKIEQFVLENIGYSGVFLFMGGSGSLRSKKGFKWVKLFKCKISEHPEGLRCQMTNNYRLWRYSWFYKD